MRTDKKFTGEKNIPEPFKLTRPRSHHTSSKAGGLPVIIRKTDF